MNLSTIKLDEGNMRLKPSHRKQLMAWLKRSLRLGERLGEFVLTIKLHRDGRQVDTRGAVHVHGVDFNCHSRKTDWQSALRELVQQICHKLHQVHIERTRVLVRA